MQYKRQKFIFIWFLKYTSLLHDLRMLRVSFLWMFYCYSKTKNR